MVYSSLSPAGLSHPAPGYGVRAVSPRASCWLLLSSQPSSRCSPCSPLSPFRAFPSSTAVLRHRSRCLLAVNLVLPAPVLPPPCSACRPDLNLEAFLRVRVRCCPLRCRCDQPDALLGFIPLQGTPSDRGVRLMDNPLSQRTEAHLPCQACPNRPLYDFPAALHRCRWHPANRSLVFQRPARRRRGVCSTCSPPRLA
jgi:hypothetical protein